MSVYACWVENADIVFDPRRGLTDRAGWVKIHGMKAFHALPRYDRMIIDTSKPYGQRFDELGRPVLNVGAAGLVLILTRQGETTDEDVRRFFPESERRFWEFAKRLAHLHAGTMPTSPEEGGLLMQEFDQNAALFTEMGFRRPQR